MKELHYEGFLRQIYYKFATAVPCAVTQDPVQLSGQTLKIISVTFDFPHHYECCESYGIFVFPALFL